MAYATVEQARAAGATGTDAEVLVALDAASATVDRWTGQWWTVRVATLVSQVDRDGHARLARRVVAVTSVTVVGSDTPMAVSQYQVESSANLGGRDRVLINTGRWDSLTNHDPLHYSQQGGPDVVAVAGQFGVAPTPGAIVEVSARLAAAITGAPSVVNAEGDASAGSPPRVPALTFPTLDPVINGLLAPYVKRRTMVS